ncbi:MAG TPA: hypothetical protein VGI84_08945 [Pseudonocardiaceae bacterium]
MAEIAVALRFALLTSDSAALSQQVCPCVGVDAQAVIEATHTGPQ